MGIVIKEVISKQDVQTFIYLPEKIHQNHPNWVHPLYMDEEKFFSRKRNPAFQYNTAILLLAYKNGQPVGRIMAIVPHPFNERNGVKTARFSYFECFEDEEVFDALLHAAEHWARQQNCSRLVGPMGFSDKEPQGFLTSGFDAPTMIVTNCSFRFMKDFILSQGYDPHVELCQYDVPISAEVTERYEVFAQRVERNLDLQLHEFKSTARVKPFVRPVFELINRSYEEIYGFTSVSRDEMNEFANRFLPLLNPRLIKIITNRQQEVAAFVIALPDLSPGLKKAKGRMLPFGWFHILKASRSSKRLQLLLGAIDKRYQNKGLDAALATVLFRSAIHQGFEMMDSHLIMRSNHKMRGEIERLTGHKMYKEYTIYSKVL